MVNYTPFASDDDSYRRGLSFAFPCCSQCTMGAVTFAIKLPDKKA